MDKKHEKTFNKIMSKFLFFSFLMFAVLYIYKSSGYYDFYNYKKTSLTNEQIKEFEKDIKNGKNIKIKDYVDEKSLNYDNLASNLGYGISEQIRNIITNGFNYTSEFFGQLFSN